MRESLLFLSRLVILVCLASMAYGATKTHNCIPSGISGMCVIGSLHYDSNDTTTQHVFPKNYSMISIANHGESKYQASIIPRFDAVLYSALGKPTTLEIILVRMVELEVPLPMLHGSFYSNDINQLTIEPGEISSTPAVIYLDLSYNTLSNISIVSSLVNLEVLYLNGNSIKDIEPNTLNQLNKLRYLSLQNNYIHQLSATLYPPNLIDLELYHNKLESLNYTDLNFPALEVLNVEHNKFETINVTALIRAMPKLRALGINDNLLRDEEISTLIEELKRRNISDDLACSFDGREDVGGVCLYPRPKEEISDHSGGIALAVLFSVLLVAVAAGFILAIRWVFQAMNK